LSMRSLKDFNLAPQIVLVRLDLDLKDKELADLSHPRLVRILPTLKFLLERRNKVIVIAHRGRPENREQSLSLAPFKDIFSALLDQKVAFCASYQKAEISNLLENNQLVILENLRFDPREEENNPEFAAMLASLADVYVFEAFGMSHRAHASVVGVPKLLETYPGFNLEKEVVVLTKIKNDPPRPFAVLIGGEKLETKMPTIESFVSLADFVLVGGKLIEEDLPQSNKIVPIVDVITADKQGEKFINVRQESYASQSPILDLGQGTITAFKRKLALARCIVWNGPLGLCEDSRFAGATRELALAITQSGAFSVVGGGETLEFVVENGLLDKFDHVSLGGGAMLEFFTQERLPALETLEWKS